MSIYLWDALNTFSGSIFLSNNSMNTLQVLALSDFLLSLNSSIGYGKNLSGVTFLAPDKPAKEEAITANVIDSLLTLFLLIL